jgi:tetratricopeptide (TPR) repeat protein
MHKEAMDNEQGSRKWVFVAAAAAAVAAIGAGVYYTTAGEKEDEASVAEEPATTKVAAAPPAPPASSANAAPPATAAAAPASQAVAPPAEPETVKTLSQTSKPSKLTKRDLQFLRGMVHKREQNYVASFADVKEVSEAFTSGVDVGVYTVDALYEYACYLELEGLLDDALQHIMHALQLDPEHVLSLVKLGYVQFSKAKVEDALAAFKRAQEIDDTIGDIYLYRGMVRCFMSSVWSL